MPPAILIPLLAIPLAIAVLAGSARGAKSRRRPRELTERELAYQTMRLILRRHKKGMSTAAEVNAAAQIAKRWGYPKHAAYFRRQFYEMPEELKQPTEDEQEEWFEPEEVEESEIL